MSDNQKWSILQGDALKVLGTFAPNTFDAVITDPPYASGGRTQTEKNKSTARKYSSMGENAPPPFDGDAKDQRSWTRWAAEWLYEARKVCKSGAPVCMFIDWRQLPAATDALQWAGWIWRGTAVWDKGNSRPQKGRFRQQAEYIVWGSNGDMPISRPVPCLPGVFKYPKILATCRSYNIGLNIIVQNIQNIKALYEKEWESIIGNCDTLLFLGGGNEPTSLEFVVKLLGKETLATRTRGQTKGRNGSSSTNFQQTGRELMTLDEVRKLGTNQAILFIRGESPVLDEKYNIKNHPNIRLTVDGKAKPYVHKPQGAPNYALPDLPYEFKSLDDYEFINMEESEHEETEKEDDAES